MHWPHLTHLARNLSSARAPGGRMSLSGARLWDGRQAEEGGGDQAEERRQDELAAREVDVRDVGQLLEPGGEGEADRGRRADRGAVHAVDALAALPALVGIGMGLGLAVLGAEAALDAFLAVDPELEQVPAAEEAQEGAGRAEIAAPEPLLPGVEGDRAEEEKAHRESLDEGRVDRPVLEGLGDRAGQSDRPDPVEGAVQAAEGLGQRGQHGHGQGPGQEGEGIEVAGEIEAEEGADQDDDEDVVLRGQAGLVLARRPEELRPLEGERRELVDGAERADPAAEDAAEEDGRGDRDRGRRRSRRRRGAPRRS